MGGKSAHGQNGKHHYYDGLTHKKRCRLERIRAGRTEKMVLGFLKEVLSKPELIEQMVEAYYKQTRVELPGIEGRLKAIELDIAQTERRVENLINRLSELPAEVSAEAIYEKLKVLNEKLTYLKASKLSVEAKKIKSTAHTIDKESLKDRINQAVAALEQAPTEKQRPIFANAIQFAEVYPTKVRLGLYAPLASRAGSCSVQSTARREHSTDTVL